MDTNFPMIVTAAIGGETVPTANARDLHTFLQVGRDFTTWIKGRLAEYGFAEGVDYVVAGSPDRGNQSGRGGDRRSVDYHLTLDVAKELAMLENNERGRQVRRYFIECERQARAARSALPQSLPEALRLAADLAEELSRGEDTDRRAKAQGGRPGPARHRGRLRMRHGCCEGPEGASP